MKPLHLHFNPVVMRIALILFLLLPGLNARLQNTSIIVEKEKESYVFGQIFTDFRFAFKSSYQPRAAFEFTQGVFGYSHKLGDNLTGLIMLDVTRTTHLFEITDSAGNQMNYEYFEGSKYTAFLKMAEIKWDVTPWFTFRVGQLLNTQYLTFQDRFWGYRYVDFTYQEKYRLGMPADFGAQFDFKVKDKLLNQFSVVNGEGPFRYQDMNGKFLYSNNIQYYPTDRITLKIYTDYSPSPDTGTDRAGKSVITGFAGYKTDRYRIGGEYTYVINYGYVEGIDYSGYSVYGSWVMSEKFQLLARYDHLDMIIPEEDKYLDYYILGFQYEPVQMFTMALNFRYYSPDKLPLVYANFGLKF
jgi:hypothetical protein